MRQDNTDTTIALNERVHKECIAFEMTRLKIILATALSVKILFFILREQFATISRCLQMINICHSVLRTSTWAWSTILHLSRCQERAWWPMRSRQRIVSDEEEQVIGVPTAQVTSNMPVLGPSADPTPLRGLLIAVFVLLSLPRCRCTDLGKWNPNSRERVIPKFYNFRKVPTFLPSPPFDPFQLPSLSYNLLYCPKARSVAARSQKVASTNWKSYTRHPVREENRKFPRIKMFITLNQV